MVTVTVGTESRDLEQAHESWLIEQIRRHTVEGRKPCVRVEITAGAVHLGLTTPECPSRLGGRVANSEETKVIDLWEERGLRQADWNHGKLVSFLKQIRHFE